MLGSEDVISIYDILRAIRRTVLPREQELGLLQNLLLELGHNDDATPIRQRIRTLEQSIQAGLQVY